MIKHILIPTDFSEPSARAAVYGFSLAGDLKAQVTLLHTWHIPPLAGEFETTAELKIEEEAKQQIEEFLQRINLELNKAGRPFEGTLVKKVAEGFAVDKILEIAEESKADLVVMGTHGASGITEVFLGSNTSTVIQRGTLPVLAVPYGCSYNGLKSVAYATDWREEDNLQLAKLISMIQPFQAKLDLVHIMDEGETGDFIDEENLDRAFPATAGYSNVTFQQLRASDTVEGLMAYAHGERPDILVMTSYKRGFFRRIFDRSVTEKMVNHSPVPLLALHAG